MNANASCFRLPQLLLPRAEIDLSRWAVVACDQYTSEPDYWARVERHVGDAPSTLRLTLPEVFLGHPDEAARIAAIQAAMRRYVAEGVLRAHDGTVLVERRLAHGTRRGLMLELDLEHYDFRPTSASLIRPTEGTIVERLAPRIAVRAEAELELPHILVLIDDPARTVIEPLAARRERLRPLYAMPLMEGGGHVAGHAVDADAAAQALAALQALAQPQAFAARHGVPAGTPPMLFAVGDGNHSLATAKAIWERRKAEVGMDHPSRWALVEVENIHDDALAFEPIHRVLFGVRAGDEGGSTVRAALREAFGDRLVVGDVADPPRMRDAVNAAAGRTDVHAFGLVEPGGRCAVVTVASPDSTLPVGTLQPRLDRWLKDGLAQSIDYVHGDDVVARLGAEPGHAGFHLAPMAKADLLRMVVKEGPLPRKTFSMGEAAEKRFYVEARRIR